MKVLKYLNLLKTWKSGNKLKAYFYLIQTSLFKPSVCNAHSDDAIKSHLDFTAINERPEYIVKKKNVWYNCLFIKSMLVKLFICRLLLLYFSLWTSVWSILWSVFKLSNNYMLATFCFLRFWHWYYPLFLWQMKRTDCTVTTQVRNKDE